MNRMRLNSKRVFLGAAILTIAAVMIFQIGIQAVFMISPLQKGSQETAVIEIRKGERPREITKFLRSSGILKSNSDENKFLWLGRITRQWGKIKAGEYEVSRAMTPMEILSTLTSGISVGHPITIREGENIYEIGSDLESKQLGSKDQFVSLCKSKKLIASLGFDSEIVISLEGFLFPNTYFFNRSQTPEEMIRQMVKQFRSHWGETEETRAKQLGFTQYQIITLASIIEKETGAPEERPMIGSVFFNRLKKGMRLQSDPTTIYGIWTRYKGNLHKSDLMEANPYNTYHVSALPIGPIANPGKEAIQAALFPATSDFLYFVSHNDGTHQFSRTLQEHEAAVAKFQINPKAREGKSWRDLKKVHAQAPMKTN